MFKKLSTVLLALMLVTGLAFMGCGDGGGGGGNGPVWPPAGMVDLDIEDVDGLQDAGNPVIRRAGNYLFVTGRAQNWYAIDTQLGELGVAIDPSVTYTVTVTGRAGAGLMELQHPLDGEAGTLWNYRLDSASVTTDGGAFTLTAQVLGSDMNGTEMTAGAGGISDADGGRLRVTSAVGVDFLIESFTLAPPTGDPIVLVPLGAGSGGNGGEPEPATWEDVLDEFFVYGGGHGGDVAVSASATGITATGMTATHQGLGINVVALREAGTSATPAVVITGTIVGGTGGDWGPRFEIWDNGAWNGALNIEGSATSVTIPYASNFAEGTAHRLVANSDVVATSFTITGITVGGTCILELLTD